VEWREFAGQHTLAVLSVTSAEHRPAVGRQFDGGPRRGDHIPGKQRAKAVDVGAGFAALGIEGMQPLAAGRL
jgi:hypothetical protein